MKFQDALLRCTTHRHHAASSTLAEQVGGVDHLLRDIAQAPLRTAFGTRLMSPAAVACLRKLRRLPPLDPFIAFSK